MLTLREVQSNFFAALQHEITPALVSMFQNVIAAERGLAIYRNNRNMNLRAALLGAYPVTERLVGAEFFDYAVAKYRRTHPSESGDLSMYGKTFPEFIATFEAAAGLIYLADVARLEWWVHESFHAADHAPFELQRLSEISPEHYAELRGTLHPSVRMLASPFPIDRIWHANQSAAPPPEIIDLSSGGVEVLIARAGRVVRVQALPAAAAKFLNELMCGTPLGAACELPGHIDANFDVQSVLAQWLREHIIVNLDF